MKLRKILAKMHRNTIAIPKLVFGIGYKQYEKLEMMISPSTLKKSPQIKLINFL